MKTTEELNALKDEYENMHRKLAELSENELKQVAGGLEFIGPTSFDLPSVCGVANEDKLNLPDKIRESPDGRIVYVK